MRKLILRKEILRDYPRQKNFHSIISDGDGGYKGKFLCIYGERCGYCGNTLENLPIDFFEIDHYINKTSFKSSIDVGKIENLIPACKTCNRNKLGFAIENKYKKILNPDSNIANIFYRNNDYYIVINNEVIDEVIKKFYDIMKFGDEFRRLDYLLIMMRGIERKTQKLIIKYKMNELINLLLAKRNTLTL